jgi:hypothetical protein
MTVGVKPRANSLHLGYDTAAAIESTIVALRNKCFTGNDFRCPLRANAVTDAAA